jgi:2-keto-4-pentenoate hydratase/2-oxohepta-3-ene-1,7-dioic acid hydratase in catechol pathway
VRTGLDWRSLEVIGRVNGEVRQRSNTKHLIFDVPFLIEFVSHIMTLLPGDVIITGTPAGVSPLVDGDVVEIEIDGIGVLTNSVRAASA